MSITTAQIRGARGILNWSQSELADRTGISATSIGSIENGISTARANTLITIQKAFESAGIEFIGLDGVKLRTGNVRVFTGKPGLIEFYDHLYETLQNFKGEVLVSNVDERKFVKALGEYADGHIARMSKLANIRYKILVEEGDDYLPGASYAEYRSIPKLLFASVPFYVYSDKIAILVFDPDVSVIALDYPAIAAAYKTQFADMWSRSNPVPTRTEAA